MTVHRFEASRRTEEQWAPALDAWLLQHYEVRTSTTAENMAGVDRWLTRPDGTATSVDYKVDERSAETGNYFVETVSNDVTGSPGWALKDGGAEFVVYFTPPERAVVIESATLRDAVPAWRLQYPERTADNGTYRSHGLLVPTWEVEAVCCYVADLRCDGPVMEPREEHDG